MAKSQSKTETPIVEEVVSNNEEVITETETPIVEEVVSNNEEVITETETPIVEEVVSNNEEVITETETPIVEEVKGIVNFKANDKSTHLKSGVIYKLAHSVAIRFESKGYGKIKK